MLASRSRSSASRRLPRAGMSAATNLEDDSAVASWWAGSASGRPASSAAAGGQQAGGRGGEVLLPGVELEHVLADPKDRPAAGPVPERGRIAADVAEARAACHQLGEQARRRLSQCG